MLRRGELIPHFVVTTTDGRTLRYADVWQRRNLLLILVSPPVDSPRYETALRARLDDFESSEADVVITSDALAGAPSRGIVIADRWGEIVHVEGMPEDRPLPDADELLGWINYTRMRCPECEGETK